MIFHAASMVAVFVDQLAQTPVQIQCVQQTTPESWLKQWIPTVVSLLSIGIGVWIANRAIRKNRELTLWSFREASKKEHEQWIRDQVKAEWSAILASITAVDVRMPHAVKETEWLTMSENIFQALNNVLPAMRNTLFIADRLGAEGLIAKFADFISNAAGKMEQIGARTQEINALISPDNSCNASAACASNEVWTDLRQQRDSSYRKLYRGFHEQAYEIHRIALGSFISTTDKEAEVTFSDTAKESGPGEPLCP